MTEYQGTSFTPELTTTGYAVFRAGVKVSAGTVDDLAGSLRRRHERNGTRWRLLSPVAQAVLVIAFLRTNLTGAELAAGFGISPATCWRDVRDGISVLADRGRRISLADVARLAVKMGRDYLIVDGVHVPAVTFGRKTGGQRAFYSGKHERPGLNVQTVCSPDGELLWAAAPLPGAAVDVTAARKAGIAAMLTCLIGVLADLGYPRELVYVLRDHLRRQQPAPPGQFPDPVAGALHRPVRGPAGQEQHPREPLTLTRAVPHR